jgi:hypothetical protein
MKRLLAIDGGGIRGIIPARVLVELEARTGRPLWQTFDLVSGTSTGGILACGIAAGLTAQSLLDLYVQRGGEIFSRSPEWILQTADGVTGPKYDATALEAILKQILGNLTLASAKTALLVPSYALELPRQPGAATEPGTYFFKSTAGDNAFLRDVARATSAAETYFAPYEFTNLSGKIGAFADGGTFADSPGMCAYAEAGNLWPGETLLVVALGTGIGIDPLPYAEFKDAGLVDWARPIISTFMDGQADVVDYQLRMLEPQRYFRLDIVVAPASTSMDDASAANCQALEARGAAIVASQNFTDCLTALKRPS